MKKPSSLRLLPYTGSVEIDLDFDDGSTRHFQCSPLQATLMLHIADGGVHGNGTSVQLSREDVDDCTPGRMKLTYLARLVELEEGEASTQMGYWDQGSGGSGKWDLEPPSTELMRSRLREPHWMQGED